MSFPALVHAFSKIEDLLIPVDAVLDWIRAHTDHKDIRFHPVERTHKAFRGAFRRIGISTGKTYSHDYEIVTQILYGEDLPPEWKRLVIVKEALHVFDPDGHQVNTPEAVRKLIPQVITPELVAKSPFAPAVDDFLGAYKAMALLLPRAARRKLSEASKEDDSKPPLRTSTEIARYAGLPDFYVGIWLAAGEENEEKLCAI